MPPQERNLEKRPEQEKWAQALSMWAIPQEIVEATPENPWIHPLALFEVPERIETTFSHTCAAAALPVGGSVLDVGCGGGIAAFALTPTHAIGVDHQSEMLEMFASNASSRKREWLLKLRLTTH